MKRKKDFTLQRIGGDSILVPLGAQVLTSNGIITLNSTAACVWELLAEDRSLDELANIVAEVFDVTPCIARDDVQTFADELKRLSLLEL